MFTEVFLLLIFCFTRLHLQDFYIYRILITTIICIALIHIYMLRLLISLSTIVLFLEHILHLVCLECAAYFSLICQYTNLITVNARRTIIFRIDCELTFAVCPPPPFLLRDIYSGRDIFPSMNDTIITSSLLISA